MAKLHAFFSALADLVLRFVKWYDDSLFWKLAKKMQPLGILIAIVALIYTISEIREDKVLREATLITMYVEQKEVIRKMLRDEEDAESHTHVIAREIIERMVNVGMELSWMDASNLKLNGARFQGADFAEARLRRVQLIKADLSKADFTRSDLKEAKLIVAILRKADFTEADLRNANLWKADFTDAILTDANIGGAMLKDAVGLTQLQLDSACVTSATGEPAPEVPKELRWSSRECTRINIP